jgi:hydrogenase expression/formation protein HypC
MCVGIPAQIVEIVDGSTDTALVEIGGVRRAVNISFIVAEGHSHSDCVGDWVLVHVGFAMSRIDEAEALATLELLQELGEMAQELDAMDASEALA